MTGNFKLIPKKVYFKQKVEHFTDLNGSNDFEAALADMYVDGLSDLMTHLRPVQRAKRQGEEGAWVCKINFAFQRKKIKLSICIITIVLLKRFCFLRKKNGQSSRLNICISFWTDMKNFWPPTALVI